MNRALFSLGSTVGIVVIPAIGFGLLFSAVASGDLIVAPPHSHDAAAVTWQDGHAPIPTHQHQHRTDHDPTNGIKVHSAGAGAEAYTATKVWVDRTLLTLAAGGGHAASEYAHGHQDIPARYHVHPAAAGGDISVAEAAAWNAGSGGSLDRTFDAFNGIGANDGWLDVGNASGPSNWHGTDDDEAAAPPGGAAWHSTVNWLLVDGTGPHELHVVYGEAGVGNLGLTSFVTGHSSSATITMDDDADWYYGVSTDTGVEGAKYDFATTMLHEVGHVVGLGHFGSIAAGQIMTDEVQPTRSGAGGIDHTIDADAIHGVLDLYAIAVPEPSTFILAALGLLSLVMIGRRHRRR